MKRVYMTAFEFIEKVGIGAAKAQVRLALELHPKHKFDLHNVEMFGCNVDVFELKQAIADCEMVDSYGGIAIAKRQLSLFLRVNNERGTEPSVRVANLKHAIERIEKNTGGAA